MLLPKTKEREYRFRLALRMGLPIFALTLALISNTLITTYESLQISFYIESILLLAFSIYFIFYLIYKGFSVRITEPISNVFTREYLYKYLLQDIKNSQNYTLILISIENLHHINIKYGIKNGDRVIYEVIKYINRYFKDNNISNFPFGRVNGADFIIGLPGVKEDFNTMLELLYLKSSEFRVNDIEVNLLGAITDTKFSDNLEQMVDNLFEIKENSKSKKEILHGDNISQNQLESYVINAIKSNSIDLMTQDVFNAENSSLRECFIKLKAENGKIIHPKKYMKIIDSLGLRAQYDFMILQKSIFYYNDKDSYTFALSISPTSLRDNNFLLKVKEILGENPKLKNKIIFILEEVQYYSNIGRYNSILQSLQKVGIKIAIDKLGGVHTSFLYLRDLNIDIVRFDTFYTKDIDNEKHHSIIEGFNLMAHSNGVKTWMKMVENQDIFEFTKKIGIDYTQGVYLAPLVKIKN